MNVGAVATPLPSVVTVAELENDPLTPVAGAVKVTDTPPTAILDSLTVALSAVLNAVVMAALCGVPAVAVIA